MSRLIVLLLLMSLAMHAVPTAHHHDVGGMFSEDCSLARLALVTAETVPTAPLHPAVVLDRQRVETASGTTAAPTATVAISFPRAPPSS